MPVGGGDVSRIGSPDVHVSCFNMAEDAARGSSRNSQVSSRRPLCRCVLDCYWVGSLDFNFLENKGVVH